MKVSALGVEEQRVNVIIDFDEPGGRRSRSATATASRCASSFGGRDDVLKVPVGSVFRLSRLRVGEGRGDEWAAFVVDDGRARLRIVELGQRNNEEAQILGGLEAGQAVVLHPPDTLIDGAPVTERAN